MYRRGFCGLLASALLAHCASWPAGEALVGMWKPVSADLGGRPFPLATMLGWLQLTEDSFAFAGDKGSYRILSTTTPAQLDIHATEGRHSGRVIPAIFKLEGDQLTVCYQLGTGERPTEFVSPTGSEILLMRYTRVRPSPAPTPTAVSAR
jgi:uncharacterized protein (TIGR03067 family)